MKVWIAYIDGWSCDGEGIKSLEIYLSKEIAINTINNYEDYDKYIIQEHEVIE